MAKNATKRAVKSSTAQKSAATSANAIPPPFSPAPKSLEPFLATLDTSKVYITHIDSLPRPFKQQVFAVPVLLNATILVLLIWRLYAIVPSYLAIAATLLGGNTSARVDVEHETWKTLAWIIAKRATSFTLDLALITIIWPWPLSFFVYPSNPVQWRWSIGFRDREIYVRVSRSWGREDLLDGAHKGEDSPFFKTRILPAVDRLYCKEKTGYLMMGKNFDLDFDEMVYAHELVDKKTVEEDSFKKCVYVWCGEAAGWGMWEVWKLDGEADASRAATGSTGGGAGIDENRGRILEIKERLTALGKEKLFFRWVEIVQYESTQDGGFTRERQVKAMEEVRSMFENEGIDFEAFAREVGGLDIPAEEQSPLEEID